jgi:hypothetical protein
MTDKKYTLFAFVIMIPAVIVINQQILAQNYTYAPLYDRILDYCFSSVDKILANHNPVKDLVAADLIPSHFSNMTCKDVYIEARANLSSASQSVENKK